MKRSFTSIMAVAALMTATTANADSFFFSENGAGEMDGTSWENAAPAEYLGETVANAPAGTEFYLLAGKYAPNINTGLWTIPCGVTIKGGYPATMTGTDTAITYPTEAQSIFSADIDGDGKGDNGTSCFITITNDGKKEDAAKTLLAGLTIRDAYCTSSGSYKGAALVIFSGNVELDNVKFIDNTNGILNDDGSLTGAGAVVSSCGSILYAHDCVWVNNKATRAGSALIVRGEAGQSGTAAKESEGTNPAKSVVYLDRCEFTNNVLLDPANSKATYGGTIAVGDYCGDIYINNCTATGTEISWAGAFCRLGGGDSMWLLNSTMFDFKCNYSSRYSGTILSCGTGSKLYTANTVAVCKTDGQEGMFATMMHQGGAGAVFETGGYNIWGSLNDATATVLASTDNVANTNTMSVVLGSDAPTYAAQGGNGTKVVAVKEDYRGMTVTELKALASKWNLPSQLDVTVDQRGLARPEITIAGAYDPKASTGIEYTFAKPAQTLNVATLSNGNYAVQGVEGTAYVYDINGKLVLTQNVENGSVISLDNAAKGVYILRVNDTVKKLVK